MRNEPELPKGVSISGCLVGIAILFGFFCWVLWTTPRDQTTWNTADREDTVGEYVNYLRLHGTQPRAEEVRARLELKEFLRLNDVFGRNAVHYTPDGARPKLNQSCYGVYLGEDKTTMKFPSDSKYGNGLREAKTIVVVRVQGSNAGRYVESRSNKDVGEANYVKYSLCFFDNADRSRRVIFEASFTPAQSINVSRGGENVKRGTISIAQIGESFDVPSSDASAIVKCILEKVGE